MLYDVRPYLYFVTVADELSFTVAAAKLNVAQPWLSTAIRQLEARVGFALLHRTTRRVTLTDQGLRLLPTARAALAAIDRVEDAAREIGSQEPALCLGMPPYAVDMPVTEALLKRFADEHPQYRTHLDLGFCPSLTARTESGKLHAAFTLGKRETPSLEALTLATFELVIGFRYDDRLASKAYIEPEDLRGRTVVTFPRNADPLLFDQVHAPLVAAGAALEEDPKIWTQNLEPSGDQLVAALNCKDVGCPGLKRRRLHWAPRTPYRLLRPTAGSPPAAVAFWNIARDLAAGAKVA